jgi:hypothetical protein
MEIITVLLIIAIATIIVGASLLKSSAVIPIKTPPVNRNISKITEEVYITDGNNALDYGYLKHQGIKQILIVGKELPRHGDMYFKVYHIKIEDVPDENIKKYYNPAFNFIKKNRTLIHCTSGTSRSVAIAASYLMRSRSITLDEALKLIRQQRPNAKPNPGFMAQLKQYESELSKKTEDEDETNSETP